MGSFVYSRKGIIMKALLSVYDKAGIVELAAGLVMAGVELVSSGGTAKAIAAESIPVTDVAELTGVPAILGHRVVTLHPKVHGGILADTDNHDHLVDMEEYGIEAIDLVVVNLYPFSSDPSIELIDIGGPAMVRAAAKNFARVAVVVDPADYGPVLKEIVETGGVSNEMRKRLARKAFAVTAAYDAQIVQWLDDGDPMPPTIHLALEKVGDDLRYGENPHQSGARYREVGTTSWLDKMEQHGGMEMGYLNVLDAAAAWVLDYQFDVPAVAIIKHANPCGFAVARQDVLALAFADAYDCDPRSAFGGIVAFNRELDVETARLMMDAAQADVVIAPSYAEGVVGMLQDKRKNTRVLSAPPPGLNTTDLRQLPGGGGWLVQTPHHFAKVRADWEVVTKRQPTESEWADAELAFRLVGFVKSNAIVLVKDGVAWGIGAGQQNRIESGEIANKKADGRAAGGACASDAFYPFPDGIDAAAASGATVIIQPGGSTNDKVNIARADELGLSMVFTHERHFFH